MREITEQRKSNKWNIMYNELMATITMEGHTPRSSQHPELYRWYTYQIRKMRTGLLSEEEKRKLLALNDYIVTGNKISVTPRPRKTAEERCLDLEHFVSEHGCLPYPGMGEEAAALYRWICQIKQYTMQRGLLNDEIKKRMENMGIRFPDVEEKPKRRSGKWDALWEQHFQEMNEFFEKHLRPPHRDDAEKSLFAWFVFQKRRMKDGRLPRDRKEKMLSSEWGCWLGNHEAFGDDSEWESMIKQLWHYVLTHEGATPSQEANPQLYRWYAIQTNLFHSAKLPPRRRDMYIEAAHKAKIDASFRWIKKLKKFEIYVAELRKFPTPISGDTYLTYMEICLSLRKPTELEKITGWKRAVLEEHGFTISDKNELLLPDFKRLIKAIGIKKADWRRLWLHRLSCTSKMIKSKKQELKKSDGFLYEWFARQKEEYYSGKIESYKKDALERSGIFDILACEYMFNPIQSPSEWRESCQLIEQLLAKRIKLGSKEILWIKYQCEMMNRGELPIWKVTILSSSGIKLYRQISRDSFNEIHTEFIKDNKILSMGLNAVRWIKDLKDLASYVLANGKFPTPESNPAMDRWITGENKKLKRGLLETWKLNMLIDAGFKVEFQFSC